MDSALRAQYLERLGIVTYVPRSQVVFEPVLGQWEGPKDAPLVFVFQSMSDTLDWATPELVLLKKIMGALASCCPMALCFAPRDTFDIPKLSPNTSIVVFGKGFRLPLSHKAIETLPLSELEYSEPAKRALWQALKEIKARYV